MKRPFQSSMRISGRALGYWGSQSISSDSSAMFELVKNAKDADASYVEISFENADKQDGRIIVRDDGHGMTKERIDTVWMVAGTDDRRQNRKSKGGRAVLGEMGIGRFSCERLAEKTTMRSYPLDDADMVEMVFDWKKYEERGVTMDAVLHNGYVEPKSDPDKQGLELTLEGLKSLWPRDRIEELAKDLGGYILPQGISEKGDFEIRLTVNGSELVKSGGIPSSYQNAAPLTLRAVYNGDVITVKIVDKMDGTAKTPKTPSIPSIKVGEKKCGPFTLALYFYPRDKGGATKWQKHYASVLREMTIGEFLKKYSGVYLYRDGAWVKPYGGKNDWLHLESRRVQRRSKIGLTQVFGTVDISYDKNSDIRPTAHREVLQDNEALDDLVELVTASVSELEKYRENIPRENGPGTTTRPDTMATNNLDQILETCKGKSEIAASDVTRIAHLAKAARAHIKDATGAKANEDEEGRDVRRHELNVLSIGLVASYVASEIASSLKSTISVLSDARKMMDSTDFSKPLPKEVVDQGFGWLESLESDSSKIMHFAKYVNEMSSQLAEARQNDRRESQIQIADMWNDVVDGISVSSHLPDLVINRVFDPPDLCVRFSKMDLKSVLSHLLTNAIKSIKNAGDVRQIIQIDAKHNGKNLVIKISDTGEGITLKDKDHVFHPFVTTGRAKDDVVSGHGLGLSITKKILEQYEGSDIHPRSPGDLGPGATFTVTIPARHAKKVV